jgi:hypothetical protein
MPLGIVGAKATKSRTEAKAALMPATLALLPLESPRPWSVLQTVARRVSSPIGLGAPQSRFYESIIGVGPKDFDRPITESKSDFS